MGTLKHARADAVEQNTRFAGFYHKQTIYRFSEGCSPFQQIGFDSSHYQSASPKTCIRAHQRSGPNEQDVSFWTSRLNCELSLSSPPEWFETRCNRNACCFHASNCPAHPLSRRAANAPLLPSHLHSLLKCAYFSELERPLASPALLFNCFQPSGAQNPSLHFVGSVPAASLWDCLQQCK